MTHKNLLKRLDYWARIAEFVRNVIPNRMYRFEDDFGAWWLVVPQTYTLSWITFHLVAASRNYTGMKTPPHKLQHNYHYMIQHFTKIEPVPKRDLPLYINAPHKTAMMEKILKGKRRVK